LSDAFYLLKSSGLNTQEITELVRKELSLSWKGDGSF
jgi:hypothetical protein